MTILHVINKLYTYFLENDIFDLEKNFQDIFQNSDQLDIDKALILKSLEELQRLEIIEKIKYFKENEEKDDFFWVLKSPLNQKEQSLTIKPETAMLIAQCLNAFSQTTGNKELECNVLNIKNEDIQNVINIINIISQNTSSIPTEEEN